MSLIDIILAILTLINSQGDASVTYELPAPPAIAVEVAVVVPDIACTPGVTVAIDWIEIVPGEGAIHPLQGERTVRGLEPGEVRTDVVGTFLWLQFDREVSSDTEDITSVELTPGTTSVEVCR